MRVTNGMLVAAAEAAAERFTHVAAHCVRAQFGCTALMEAARNGHADCARLLLDAGADTEAKCKVRARRLLACGGVLALRAVVEIYLCQTFFTIYFSL